MPFPWSEINTYNRYNNHFLLHLKITITSQKSFAIPIATQKSKTATISGCHNQGAFIIKDLVFLGQHESKSNAVTYKIVCIHFKYFGNVSGREDYCDFKIANKSYF